jgi:hypothetical protein
MSGAEIKILGDTSGTVNFTPGQATEAAVEAAEPKAEGPQPAETQPVETQPSVEAANEDAPSEPKIEGGQPETPAYAPFSLAAEQGNLEEVAPTTQVDPYELLGLPKEDDGIKKLIAAYKAGDLANYLAIAATDYKSMSPEELIRIDIKEKYPHLSTQEVEVLYKKKLERDYGIGGEEPDPAGAILMKADAENIRNGFLKRQAEYKIPTAPQVQPEPQAQSQVGEQEVAKFKEYVANHPDYKQFETNKMIRIGSGDEALNFEVDKTLDMVAESADLTSFSREFWDDKGNLNMAKFIKVRAYARNPEAFEKALLNHGKALKEKELHEKLSNPRPDTPEAPPDPESRIKIIKY